MRGACGVRCGKTTGQPLAAFKLVWSAVWRMQASHLVVFVALPAFAALAHALIGMALLTVLLASPSSRSHEFGAQADGEDSHGRTLGSTTRGSGFWR
jgi:hypothetical protein